MLQTIYPKYSLLSNKNALPRIDDDNVKEKYGLIKIKKKKNILKFLDNFNVILAFLTLIALSVIFYQLLTYYLTNKNSNYTLTSIENLPSPDNENLESLILRLNEIDKDKPKVDDIIISWGKLIKGNTKSDVQKPLFTYVNEELFKKPVYKALIDIYNHPVFRTPVCKEDYEIEGEKKNLIDNFLNVYTNTTIFKVGYKYLVDSKIIPDDWNTFYNKLFVFWFGTYTRCHGALGSSGWEHVFSGEWKNDEVDGHHNWIRYYLMQKEGRIDYYGHMGHLGNVTGKIHYTWDGYTKAVGGFFMNTSPSFDFTVFTLCSLPEYSKRLCHFKVDGFNIVVTSFYQKCAKGICLSTVYPL
uniref:Endoribonuclease n=1 Tax=Strongyloides stercoralis TaxID=6248 RepID=A0A0K0E789_STRER